ncbi:hypothetical protein Sjap_022293 [Stephania japonica]|uniref:Uncharacterized protein n=1 Tax=Stephania japonica TaxID=461633 RepID=A0AAP0HUA8_9MAGN
MEKKVSKKVNMEKKMGKNLKSNMKKKRRKKKLKKMRRKMLNKKSWKKESGWVNDNFDDLIHEAHPNTSYVETFPRVSRWDVKSEQGLNKDHVHKLRRALDNAQSNRTEQKPFGRPCQDELEKSLKWSTIARITLLNLLYTTLAIGNAKKPSNLVDLVWMWLAHAFRGKIDDEHPLCVSDLDAKKHLTSLLGWVGPNLCPRISRSLSTLRLISPISQYR